MDQLESARPLGTTATIMPPPPTEEATLLTPEPSAANGAAVESLVLSDDHEPESTAAIAKLTNVDAKIQDTKGTANRADDFAAASTDQKIEQDVADVDMDNSDHPEDHFSDAEDPGDSDFRPVAEDESLAEDESFSEGDYSTPQKKQQKSSVPQKDIEDVHADWNKWEPILADLSRKAETGTFLSDEEKEDLKFSRKKLERLFKEIPSSDPLYLRCKNILAKSSMPLGGRKRKNNHVATGPVQSKKTRVAVLNQTPGPRTQRNSSSQRRPPRTRKSRTSKVLISEAADLKIQQVHDRAKATFPELDPETLSVEMKDLKHAAGAVARNAKLIISDSDTWLIRGMKTSLYNYQISGVGWMLDRERSRACSSIYNPKGGILADEMGCGKTITMLAVVMAHPAPQTHKIKATLLLVQSAQMVTQWFSQIEKHCEQDSLATSRFSPKGQLNKASLGSEQIIAMTYSEVESSWKRLKHAREKKQEANVTQERLLFSETFHRLILDECHIIKNHLCATAKAVLELKSRFQWLISATPAPNRQDEYYPYLKILKLDHTNSLAEFKNFWVKELGTADGPQKGSSHLESGLERFQLSRTHKTKIAGVASFDGVPDSIETTILVNLSDEERLLYDIVVERHRNELAELKQQLEDKNLEAIEHNGKSAAGDMISKILQLHKLTAHPYLSETIMNSKQFTAEQRVEAWLAIKNSDQTYLNRLFEISSGNDTEKDDSTQSASISADSQSQSSTAWSDTVTGRNKLHMGTQLEYTLGRDAFNRRCCGCFEVTIPIHAFSTECGHILCQEHYDQQVSLARGIGPDAPVSCRCRKPVGDIKQVDQTHFAEAYATYKAAEPPKARGRKSAQTKEEPRRRGDDFNGCQPLGQDSVWIQLSDKEHATAPLTHSAKTREILKVIMGWHVDAPGDKIIVFTQWVLMARIIGRHLEDNGIDFLYYFGDLTHKQRAQNLKTFEENQKIKVIIMGLKCGGQGLDMHYANRVILCDPWWNEDGERQAFARVHRKVQKKMTFFVHLVAKDTIDERIGDIQKGKSEMTELLRKELDPVRRLEIRLQYAELLLQDRQETRNALGRVQALEAEKARDVTGQRVAPKKKNAPKKKKAKLNVSSSSKHSRADSVAENAKAIGRIKRDEDAEDAMEMDRDMETIPAMKQDSLRVEDWPRPNHSTASSTKDDIVVPSKEEAV